MRSAPGVTVSDASPSAGTAAAGTPDDTPLRLVDGWGATVAAAAVIDPSGAVHLHGDTDAVVHVASITKLCTALAVLVAVEDRSVDLDDPLGPEGSTVRHLLCHASGLDFDGEVVAEPGTRRVYSNTGFDLLGDHVAASAGLTFEEYLREGVLGPLGMDSSVLDGGGGQGLHSCVEDLVRVASELVTPTLVHPSTLATMTSVQFPDLVGVVPGWGQHTPCPWGLGPEIRGDKVPHWTGSLCSPATYGHFGGSGSLLWIDPASRLTCIAVTDRPFDAWAVVAWPPFSDAVQRYYSADGS